LRYREILGEDIEFPESCYRGEYIKDIAREIVEKEGDRYTLICEKEAVAHFAMVAASRILSGIKKDLKDFGVEFDEYFSEKELYKNNGVTALLKELEDKGFVYSDGETQWFKTTLFGDERIGWLFVKMVNPLISLLILLIIIISINADLNDHRYLGCGSSRIYAATLGGYSGSWSQER